MIIFIFITAVNHNLWEEHGIFGKSLDVKTVMTDWVGEAAAGLCDAADRAGVTSHTWRQSLQRFIMANTLIQ